VEVNDCSDLHGETGVGLSGRRPLKLVSGPRPSAVNGDWDPAALTGDRTRQVTSTGVSGYPWGIDIGGRSHALARCRDGQAKADREILRVSQSRAGFAAIDAWLERQTEPVTF
jgi:hypothetical protein